MIESVGGQRHVPGAEDDAMKAPWPVGPVSAAIGIILGGAAGYFGFFALARLGLYALVLPGALLGVGCGLGLGRRSMAFGAVCGVLGLLLGLFTEWQFEPFVDDPSLSYFIEHVKELRQRTLLMLAAGVLFAFWFGQGRNAAS
jgi:hypothetical protein